MTDALDLAQLEQGSSTAQALAFFDTLQPVSLETLYGAWHGSGLPTDHPMDGLLELFGWHGKRFTDIDGAHPLIFASDKGALFSVNPVFVPIALVITLASLLRQAWVSRIAKRILPLFRTRKPKARIRLTEYRGIISATMIYDALPINDVFRQVDPDTLIGAMDLRGVKQPFFFILRREQ